MKNFKILISFLLTVLWILPMDASYNFKKHISHGHKRTAVSSYAEFEAVCRANWVKNRNALTNPNRYWPDNTLVYSISKIFGPQKEQKILKAMDLISAKSCIRFRLAKDDWEPQVKITHNTVRRCSSKLGFLNQPQVLTLADECLNNKFIQHELLHALGLHHMQVHPDRDAYVKIMYENIKRHKLGNFCKTAPGTLSDFDVGYDYHSVMHYDEYAFAIDSNLPTIVPLQKGIVLGNEVGLTEMDFLRLNRVYNCPHANN